LAFLGLFTAFAAAPFAGLINFDCSFAEGGYAPYGPGPGAIGSAGDLWNAFDIGNPTTPLSLTKSDGTLTTATWNISTGGGTGGPVPGPYTWLFDINASIYSASISGLIPGATYRLYIYAAYWSQDIRVNGVDFVTPATHQNAVTNLSGWYAVHNVIADPSGTLAFVPYSVESGGNVSISSWQLTTVVPEPNCIVLVLLGTALALRTVSSAPRLELNFCASLQQQRNCIGIVLLDRNA
jgi:hypothetical protein